MENDKVFEVSQYENDVFITHRLKIHSGLFFNNAIASFFHCSDALTFYNETKKVINNNNHKKSC